MAEIYQLPENGNNGNATIPFSIPIGFGGMNNGGFGFGNGMNGIYDLLGVAIIASLFGWGTEVLALAVTASAVQAVLDLSATS